MIKIDFKKTSKIINIKSLMIYNISFNNIFTMENIIKYKSVNIFKFKKVNKKDKNINKKNKKINKKEKYKFSNEEHSFLQNYKYSFLTKNINDVIIKDLYYIYGGSNASFHTIEYNSKKYFCKVFDLNKKEANTILKTLFIQKSVNDENICKVEKVIRKINYNGHYYYVLFEFCKNGDLCTFIENYNKNNNYNKFMLNKFIYQVINSINVLHKNNISHRDIKPENFVINAFNKIKITDFDYCTTEEKDHLYRGTEVYMSPEMIYCKNLNEILLHNNQDFDKLKYNIINFKPVKYEVLTEVTEIKKTNLNQAVGLFVDNIINNALNIYENEPLYKHFYKNNFNIENNKDNLFIYDCKANDMYCLGSTFLRVYYGKTIDTLNKFLYLNGEYNEEQIFNKKSFLGYEYDKQDIDECIKNLIFTNEQNRWKIENVIKSNFYKNLEKIYKTFL